MTRIVAPHVITVDEIVTTIAARFITDRDEEVGKAIASGAVDAMADLVATNRDGIASALTLFRANLCGAADVLPHVEAELARIRAAVRALHRPCHTEDDATCTPQHAARERAVCRHCVGEPWPCPTARAVGVEGSASCPA